MVDTLDRRSDDTRITQLYDLLVKEVRRVNERDREVDAALNELKGKEQRLLDSIEQMGQVQKTVVARIDRRDEEFISMRDRVNRVTTQLEDDHLRVLRKVADILNGGPIDFLRSDEVAELRLRLHQIEKEDAEYRQIKANIRTLTQQFQEAQRFSDGKAADLIRIETQLKDAERQLANLMQRVDLVQDELHRMTQTILTAEERVKVREAISWHEAFDEKFMDKLKAVIQDLDDRTDDVKHHKRSRLEQLRGAKINLWMAIVPSVFLSAMVGVVMYVLVYSHHP